MDDRTETNIDSLCGFCWNAVPADKSCNACEFSEMCRELGRTMNQKDWDKCEHYGYLLKGKSTALLLV